MDICLRFSLKLTGLASVLRLSSTQSDRFFYFFANTVEAKVMENAALYHRSNDAARRGVKQVVDEYSHLFRWRGDGKDSLLDIGCGPGDITVDYILPLLPSNFSRLVGADLSDEMVRYGRENFQQSKMSYQKLDIGIPQDQLEFNEPFDHITSFYCLHWVENQEQALKNVYNLLSPGGDCLLSFMPASQWFDIFKRMALTSKWAPYFADIERMKYAYQYSADPADDLKTILNKAGFEEYQVNVHVMQYAYDGKEALKNFFGAVYGFTERMSADLQDECVDEIVSSLREHDRIDSKIVTTYKILVAFARK